MEELLSKIAIGVISGLTGLFFGHRLNLGRDRRKEFNDAIQPLRETLNKGGNITKEMIYTLESKTGKASTKIVKTFNNEYQTALALPTTQYIDLFGISYSNDFNSHGFDDFGNIINVAPLTDAEIVNNIKQKEIATEKLKKLLALK